jgi:hypothetical protein
MGAAFAAGGVAADPRWFDEHWLELYCPVSRATPVWEIFARALLGATGLGLIGAAVSVVPRWIVRHGPARAFRMVARIAIGLVLALIVSDAILRWRARAKPDVADEPALPPMVIDATGNYAPSPRRTKQVILPTRRVEYAIDGDGDRAARADHVPDPATPAVLFAGESVTLGWGVAYEKTYPAIVGAAMGVQAINLAVTGFANDQAYLRVKAALATFERPVAVVMLVIPSQLARNVSVRRDRLALSNGRLVIQRASTSPFATSPLRDLFRYHSAEAVALTRAIFQATIEAATARGARPLFVWTNFGPPCLADDSGETALEDSLFGGLHASHVRVEIRPEQTLQPPQDQHPNEAGHLAIAEVILAALRAPEAVSR